MKKLRAILAATATLAGAATADAVKDFNIGILGGENAQDRLTAIECYRAAVEKGLGVPVKLFTPADYDGVIQGLPGGTPDMAWLGASAYAKNYVTDPKAVDVELTTMRVNGATGYCAIGFTRKDTGITSMDGAKGHSFAFGEPNFSANLAKRAAGLPVRFAKT